jgi:hypothetical protein
MMMNRSNNRVPRAIIGRVLFTGLLLSVVSFANACVTGQSDLAPDASAARDLAFQYRQEALRLMQLADTLELEKKFASNSTEAANNLSLPTDIGKIRQQADLAFERARFYRSQVPHNQMN